ncbi:MAG: 1-acyl-sn-glycerol-3-phosphate acyltransferase, partial [Burkholderiaceae bacterium]|nr:1-acyl-sn-glycerol-3-phosphate acyltransferase [Burkholderiaceae bacterium]
AGEVLVLFPECTRTGADGVMRLRRGAAQIAVRSGCPVIPVTIDFSEPLLTKRSRWWQAPKVKPHVRVVQHATIDPSEFMQGNHSAARNAPPSAARAARGLTEHLQALYMKELSRRGSA